MRVGLSVPDTNGERSVLLSMTPKEERLHFWPFYRVVMQGRLDRQGRRPFPDEGVVRYRVPIDYLEQIVNTFPFAEVSPVAFGEIRHLYEIQTNGAVPDLKIPGMKGTLYDYQKVGVKKIIENERYFITDVMGLGKTLMALAGKHYLNAYPSLVVCPNSAKWVWKREAEKFFPGVSVSVVSGNAADRRSAIEAGADITVIHFEALRLHPELALKSYKMIVTDEYHRIRNPSAQQTKAFHKLQSDRWLLMSGTPILNRPDEAWSGLHRLFPNKFPSFFLFQSRYCIKGGYKNKQVVGYKNLPELRSFISKVSIRRRAEDVLQDLPERIHNVVLVEMTTEQRRLYDKIAKESKLKLASGEIKSVPGVLAAITRLKQAAFSPELYGGSKVSAKIEELKEIVAELVANGEKAIIFSQWSRATRIIERELAEYNPAYVDGSVKDTKTRQRRMEQIDKFNHDETCAVYAGTIGANKEAITLSAATHVIFTDKAWTPAENEQAIARSAAGGLRGVGKKGQKVHVIDLFAVDTIEERIERVLAGKQRLFDAIFEKSNVKKVDRRVLKSLTELFEED